MTARDDTPLWLFADQLGPAVYGGEHAHREVLLVEAASALGRRRYHRQKLHLVLSALRHAHRDLENRATLLKADTYTDALQRYRRPVLVHEPTSHAAERFVHRLKKQGLVADILPTPTFALPRADFRAVGRRADALSDGGLLPRSAASLRRFDERRRPAGRPLELRHRESRISA